jgi:hypothetical protein
MSQIQIEITDAADQRRFDQVLARTLDMVLAADADAMITVHTEGRFDHFVKIVKCTTPDALTFFSATYDDEGACYV